MTRRHGFAGGRRGLDFGLDAPPAVYANAALGLAGVALLILSAAVSPSLRWPGVACLLGGAGTAGAMLYSSRVGKVRMRDRLLDGLDLSGDEQVLDLGCGGGLMLLGAAQRLTTGHATGIDLWRSRDQAGASAARCHRNARRLDVAERVTILDGDMTELPFPDASFDVVLACLAIHNLHPTRRREMAIREASRVLRPGGRLAVVDIAGTKTYTTTAAAAGLQDIHRSGYLLGIFPPARTVTGAMPPPA